MRTRVCTGLSVLIAFFAALTLASTPHWHDQLHPTGAEHECAATIISFGNCEDSAAPQVVPAVENAPSSPAFLPKRFPFVVALVPSSIQEHTPPPTSR
jgi:hypothetical protein